MDMESLKNKLGPLPVWAWGVIVGGILVAVMFFKNGFGGSASDEPVESYDPTTDPNFRDSSQVNIVGEQPDEDVNYDNSMWLSQGIKSAAAAGKSMLEAQVALSRYLDGETLTASQASIVSLVIGAIGTPPNGTPTPSVSTPTEPKAVSHATTLTLSAPSSMKFGQAANVALTVKAADSRAGTPAGTVVLYLNGKARGKAQLANGSANIPLSVSKDADGLIYLRAKFQPRSPWRASNSSEKVVKISK